MPSSTNNALVFGASGITGWSVVRELLEYPTPKTFASIIGLTNREYSSEMKSLLPSSSRINFISGVDLTLEDEDKIIAKVKSITDIEKVTHAFLFAYIHNPPKGHTMVSINLKLMQSMLLVLRECCPNTRHVVFQTGGKTYGHHLTGIAQDLGHHNFIVPIAPLKEAEFYLTDLWLGDYIHYYRQIDLLMKEGERQSDWTWTHVIPDAIIGYSPMSNDMNLAKGLAIFLLMWKKTHKAGSHVPFPGSKSGYNVKSTLSDMKSVAHFLIWTSLHPQQTSKETYNISEVDYFKWSERWPILAAKFDLVGVEPDINQFDLAVWANDNEKVWNKIVSESNLRMEGRVDQLWPFVVAMLGLQLDRQFDNTKRLQAGFTEKGDGVQAMLENWSLLEQSNQLPKGSFNVI